MDCSSNSRRPIIICPRTPLPQVRHTVLVPLSDLNHLPRLSHLPFSTRSHLSLSMSGCRPAGRFEPHPLAANLERICSSIKVRIQRDFHLFFILFPLSCERPCLSINQQRACLFQGHLGSIPLNKKKRRNYVTLDKTSTPSLVF